jgi:pyridoxal 5'-phosphate synthase pdxT subunit
MTTASRIPGEAWAPARAGAPDRDGRGAAGGPLVGVLAVQGDVLEHLRMLRDAGARATPVRRPDDLEALDAVLLPGGESTTIGKLCAMYGLLEPLRASIAEGLPAFGTCAGAILLSRRALLHDGRPSDQPLLGVLDATARRNAFGRQVASFEADLDIDGIDGGPLHAVFIRAPWFEDVGADVEVLARVDTPLGARVVVARQAHVLASAFHPELAADGRLHAAFVDLVRTLQPRET